MHAVKLQSAVQLVPQEATVKEKAQVPSGAMDCPEEGQPQPLPVETNVGSQRNSHFADVQMPGVMVT